MNMTVIDKMHVDNMKLMLLAGSQIVPFPKSQRWFQSLFRSISSSSNYLFCPDGSNLERSNSNTNLER